MRQQALGYRADLDFALHILERAAAVTKVRKKPLKMGYVWRGLGEFIPVSLVI